MRRRGFTLVELLVVIAIIGLLFALLVQSMAGIDRLKKDVACKKNLNSIHKFLGLYVGESKGRYPWPIDAYYGRSFSANVANVQDPWGSIPQWRLLTQMGATVDMFYCPFDPAYGDWTAWPASTWKAPYMNSGKTATYVYFGYGFFIARGYPYGSYQFSNGKNPIVLETDDDATPIVADMMFYRTGSYPCAGWYHGGGWTSATQTDGLFNSDCNTLFKNGVVVHTDKEAFGEWENPVMVSSSKDLWFCALEPK